MKVLHGIDKMDPKQGGVCQAVRTIIAGLTELGIDNEVVCLDGPNEDFLLSDDFIKHALGPSNNYWSFNRKLMPWLLDNLCDYDAVIVHGLWLYPTYAFNRVKRQLKKKILSKNKLPKLYVMPHGMLDPYFQTASGRKLKAIRNTIYWELLEKEAVNNADGILFTCETECLLARVPFKSYHPKQEIIVGLGVEEPPAYLKAMKTAFLLKCKNMKDKNYLLFLSRIHEKKGVDILLDAYAKLMLTEEHNGKSINGIRNISPRLPKLVIAGPGLESNYGKRILQMVHHNPNLKENVVFPGMLSGNAKWGAFYGCDAFLLASHQENFGIAVVEALACKKPVLITNKVNIYREIENAGCGLVANDTLPGVSHLLEKWMKMPEREKNEMGKKAGELFVSQFRIGTAADKFRKKIGFE